MLGPRAEPRRAYDSAGGKAVRRMPGDFTARRAEQSKSNRVTSPEMPTARRGIRGGAYVRPVCGTSDIRARAKERARMILVPAGQDTLQALARGRRGQHNGGPA